MQFSRIFVEVWPKSCHSLILFTFSVLGNSVLPLTTGICGLGCPRLWVKLALAEIRSKRLCVQLLGRSFSSSVFSLLWKHTTPKGIKDHQNRDLQHKAKGDVQT